MPMIDKYHEYGCIDRHAYLIMLADLHDVPFAMVQTLADQLGSAADFTLLPIALMDYERHIAEMEFVETLTLPPIEA